MVDHYLLCLLYSVFFLIYLFTAQKVTIRNHGIADKNIDGRTVLLSYPGKGWSLLLVRSNLPIYHCVSMQTFIMKLPTQSGGRQLYM